MLGFSTESDDPVNIKNCKKVHGQMTSKEIRQSFLDYFREKNHQIIPSAPMVIKNDPTLMFTNAGMNQFKDIFLGHQSAKYRRIANTQKCLRVSGKHNDLEEVGLDTYHHTMFEMLGNWSFGDYFKEDAIAYAWNYLTEKLGIEPDRLYATIFEGDSEDGLDEDEESYRFWKKHIKTDHILKGSRKDNFWEMGETGPCGPCSEIHIDIRPDKERKKVSGSDLVNRSDPNVIELWNLVFIQYNRKSDGKLESLPMKHIDTGLGLERLCMVLQSKSSNYDTDLFQPIIREASSLTGIKYGSSRDTDTALRVVADHLRAISFAITDGQLPSNNKAGYVIRRILRRALRYGYTFLEQKDPFICRLVPVLTEVMGDAFPEIRNQTELVQKVIREEETAFLKTLDKGIRMLDQIAGESIQKRKKKIDGKSAFILYDTYGFPLDLTQLILREKGLAVDLPGFDGEMQKQKSRSKDDAVVTTEEWTELMPAETTEFVGYDTIDSSIRIVKFRRIEKKGKDYYHLVFDKTPFYAESGGQVGDQGYIESGTEKIPIIDIQKENNLILHLSSLLPSDMTATFHAVVTEGKRSDTARNHTSTHLLHHALRQILGRHVEQKGSLVHPDYLRFDFSHFQKVTDEELIRIESLVNELIRQNLPLEEKRSVGMKEAKDMGALAFFGEKYGDHVRVIRFGSSIELCGGTHVRRTGDIGSFIIVSESAIAAGIRRIEARSGRGAEDWIRQNFKVIEELKKLFKTNEISGAVQKMLKENRDLKEQSGEIQNDIRAVARDHLKGKVRKIGKINVIAEEIYLKSADNIKTLAYELKHEIPDLVLVTGANLSGKAHLTVMISEDLVRKYKLDAREIIREIAPEIEGGGGGQSFYSTAGGKKPQGISSAINRAINILQKTVTEK
jgi:alanyl-tRNA synthetase